MKEIKVVTRLQKVAALHAALRARPDFPGMTVSRTEIYTPEHHDAPHSIREELTDHVKRVRIELVVPDESARPLFDAIVATLSRGAPGDSQVWINDVERVSFVHRTA